MTTTVIYDDRVTQVDAAEASGGSLWLSPDDFTAASGWKPEPEGLCRGDACIRANAAWVNDAGHIDLGAFAEHLNQPLLRDEANDVWAFGESVSTRRDQLLSTVAPDFTLPDLDGKQHSLSDYRGKKVFLYSWGSY